MRCWISVAFRRRGGGGVYTSTLTGRGTLCAYMGATVLGPLFSCFFDATNRIDLWFCCPGLGWADRAGRCEENSISRKQHGLAFDERRDGVACAGPWLGCGVLV